MSSEHKKQTPFFDNIRAIHINNNNVKIDFGNQDMEDILQNQGSNKPVLTQSSYTVVMPLTAFLYTIVRFTEDQRNADMVNKMREIVQNEMSGGAMADK